MIIDEKKLIEAYGICHYSGIQDTTWGYRVLSAHDCRVTTEILLRPYSDLVSYNFSLSRDEVKKFVLRDLKKDVLVSDKGFLISTDNYFCDILPIEFQHVLNRAVYIPHDVFRHLKKASSLYNIDRWFFGVLSSGNVGAFMDATNKIMVSFSLLPHKNNFPRFKNALQISEALTDNTFFDFKGYSAWREFMTWVNKPKNRKKFSRVINIRYDHIFLFGLDDNKDISYKTTEKIDIDIPVLKQMTFDIDLLDIAFKRKPSFISRESIVSNLKYDVLRRYSPIAFYTGYPTAHERHLIIMPIKLRGL